VEARRERLNRRPPGRRQNEDTQTQRQKTKHVAPPNLSLAAPVSRRPRLWHKLESVAVVGAVAEAASARLHANRRGTGFAPWKCR
jgi:hypothetical protein